MGIHNPFTQSETVAGYEAWYQTDGFQADQKEKYLLKWLLRYYPQAHSILEVGCGTGHFTRWFRQQGLQAVGYDLSHPMLEESIRLKSDPVVQGDAMHLAFPAKSFDLLAFITTLEFLPHPTVALAEAFRIARQGIILGVLNRQSCLGVHYKRSGGPIWEVAHFFTVGELKRNIFETAGKRVHITWRTTLWPLGMGLLPLPWGGFIGMAIIY